MPSERHAKLILDAQTEIELPIHQPTKGKPTVDVSTLGQHGYFTYDQGYVATASCTSEITYIDGQEGILTHRGHRVEDLAQDYTHCQLSQLLLNGTLPVKDDHTFDEKLKAFRRNDSWLKALTQSFDRNAHPMAILMAQVTALSAASPDCAKVREADQREHDILTILANSPILAAWAYAHTQGKPLVDPNPELGYIENFIAMLFGTEAVNETTVRALDKIFMIHADHEQNASTSTVRAVGTTLANAYVSVASGIAALWGPAHGGANEACLRMLEEIGDESRLAEYVQRAKNPDDNFRLMGFGHRVYKNFDPRAKIMAGICHDVLQASGDDDPLFQLAVKLQEIAREDDYFIQRKLYPNVDFYSGITQSALGLPTNMFTVIFAVARCSGWLSHWSEMHVQHNFKITRPRQLYTGK